MAWLESHQDLGRHPKTKRLARSLATSVPTAIGHLHLLWWWALDFADNGILTAYSAGEIAEAALWEGDPDAFVAALAQAGFIDQTENVLSIHDWDEYAGKLVDARRNNAEKQKRWRESHRRVTNTNEEKQSVCNDDVTVTYPLRNPATVPNRTQPNRTKPEENGASIAREPNVSPAASSDIALPLAKAPPQISPNRQMWTAFVIAGLLEPKTTDERGKWNRGIGQLLAVGKTPVDAPSLMRRYQDKFGSEIACNPMAIARNLSVLEEDAAPSQSYQNGRSNGRSPPSNPYLTAEQLAEKARLDQEQLAEFVAQDQAKWKH